MDIAHVRLTGRRQLVSTDGSGHSVVMDAKPEYKGEGSGIRPVELVLHGLAGCTAMDVISVLEKKRQDVRDIEIVIKGEPRIDDYPKIYTRIEIEYIVTGFRIKPEAVARAIELSEEKYCSVKGMLREEVQVVTSFTIKEAPVAGTPSIDRWGQTTNE